MKTIFTAIVFLWALSAFAQNRALIIIDIQDFYFPGGDAELVDPEKAGKNAGKVLDYFRNNDELVVHVRHNYEPGGDIHESVAPIGKEKIFSKDYANSFRETGLDNFLKDNDIDELVIVGMQTHMCVEATTRAAADLGYRCMVVSDACTTRDLRFGDRTISWEEVHYSTLSTLKSGYAKILTTDEFTEAQ
jgi:nicotinamidase-related amidase